MIQERQLFSGTQDMSDPGDGGDNIGCDLRIATHDHHLGLGIYTNGAADQLARLHGGLAGHCAGVYAVEVGGFSERADQKIGSCQSFFQVGRFTLIYLAPEGCQGHGSH
jgi:hypothetical protein